MKDYYDLIIVGAGISGSYLASNLDPSIGSILIIDKRVVNRGFVEKKPCSGLISLNAQPLLNHMLSQNINNILAEPNKLKVRIVDVKTERFIEQNEFVYNINRLKLEQNLLSSIPNFVEKIYDSSFVNYKEEDNGLKLVNLIVDKKLVSTKTRLLVGADGANSKLRKNILDFKSDSIHKYIGIEWFVECDQKNVSPYFNIIIDKKLTDYYLWTFPKNDYILVGGIFKKMNNPNEIPELLLKTLRKLGIIKGSDFKIFKIWAHPILRPLKKKDIISNSNDGVYLIGEASGLICPTSAEGYSYALHSASRLAFFLNRNSKRFIDTQSEKRIQKKIFRKKIIYNNLIRFFFMIIFGKKY